MAGARLGRKPDGDVSLYTDTSVLSEKGERSKMDWGDEETLVHAYSTLFSL